MGGRITSWWKWAEFQQKQTKVTENSDSESGLRFLRLLLFNKIHVVLTPKCPNDSFSRRFFRICVNLCQSVANSSFGCGWPRCSAMGANGAHSRRFSRAEARRVQRNATEEDWKSLRPLRLCARRSLAVLLVAAAMRPVYWVVFFRGFFVDGARGAANMATLVWCSW